jgi:hypothetical protein
MSDQEIVIKLKSVLENDAYDFKTKIVVLWNILDVIV